MQVEGRRLVWLSEVVTDISSFSYCKDKLLINSSPIRPRHFSGMCS